MTARSSYPKSQGALGILGMRLYNNSIFLVRLQICSTTRPKLNWGQWQGRLKTRAKITQKSYALSLKGLAGACGVSWLCFPRSWGVYGNQHHPVPLLPQGQRGTTAGTATPGASKAAPLPRPLVQADWNSAREGPLCLLRAAEMSEKLWDF